MFSLWRNLWGPEWHIVCNLVLEKLFIILNSTTFIHLWEAHIYDRHGIRQLGTAWADGPAYVTQCPIQPGKNYVYNFTVTGQRGTLLWHAHISWLRATVHGAIVVLPKKGIPYPFPKPHKEKIIVLGDYFFI